MMMTLNTTQWLSGQSKIVSKLRKSANVNAPYVSLLPSPLFRRQIAAILSGLIRMHDLLHCRQTLCHPKLPETRSHSHRSTRLQCLSGKHGHPYNHSMRHTCRAGLVSHRSRTPIPSESTGSGFRNIIILNSSAFETAIGSRKSIRAIRKGEKTTMKILF